MTWVPVAKVGDVGAGDVIAVDVEGRELVLARDGDHYIATQRQCLHRGGDLSYGIVSRGHIVCPMHGWRFSTATGCLDTASNICLTVHAVRVVGEQIEIDSEPRKASS